MPIMLEDILIQCSRPAPSPYITVSIAIQIIWPTEEGYPQMLPDFVAGSENGIGCIIRASRLLIVCFITRVVRCLSKRRWKCSRTSVIRISIIQTHGYPGAISYTYVEIPKTVQFSAQPSNKWNACVIFGLVRLIISQYSGQKRLIVGAILSAAHAAQRVLRLMNKFTYLNTLARFGTWVFG